MNLKNHIIYNLILLAMLVIFLVGTAHIHDLRNENKQLRNSNGNLCEIILLLQQTSLTVDTCSSRTYIHIYDPACDGDSTYLNDSFFIITGESEK